MHLKSLTLKGFKSFASATTLKFEPGICAVVGPNGSGKSNIVDALRWVMGDQGAKNLRGGKMEDVIFAGGGDRKPLGRAEVTLTIDNRDGKLGVGFAEVSVTRRMFRDGSSEYEINGARARLMDIQELLSDSGIGREMHIIVGQNKLGEILDSRPEDRRAFIEEAAGVLKHRRRKEKAQRKLVGMQANLDRVQDLVDELAKQLTPLARQAEAAQKAATVQAQARQARLALAADRVRAVRAQREEAARSAELSAQKAAAVTELLDEQVALQEEAEVQAEHLVPAAEQAQQWWFRLSTLAERVSATQRIAAERAASAGQTTAYSGPDPDDIEARAEVADEEHERAVALAEEAAERLEEVREQVAEYQEAFDATEAEHLAQVRATADRREGVVRLLARQESLDAQMRAAREAADQHEELVAGTRERVREAQQQMDALAEQLAARASGREPVADVQVRATSELQAAELRLEQVRAQQRNYERRADSLRARIETLKESAPGTVAELGKDFLPLAQLVRAQPGWERALAVALGAHAEAVAGRVDKQTVEGLADAARRVIVLPGQEQVPWQIDATVPAGATWLIEYVEVDAAVSQAVTRLLADVVVADNYEQAVEIVQSDPRVRVVTPEGILFGEGWVEVGRGAASTVEVSAQIAAASAELSEAAAQVEELAGTFAGAAQAAEEARVAAAAATAQLRDYDAETASLENQHQALEKQVCAAAAEHEATAERATAADITLARLRTAWEEVSERVARVDDTADDASAQEETAAARAAAQQALTQVKAMEMEATLAARQASEAAAHSAGRGDSLRRQAQQEREAKVRHDAAMEKRKLIGQLAKSVEKHARTLALRVAEALEQATARRDELSAQQRQLAAQLVQVKDRVNATRQELARVTDTAHAAAITREQAIVRADEAEAKIVEQLGVAVADLPDLGEDFDREATEKELKKAERALRSLGKVNPLALEEYRALEERYSFLSTQLNDVLQARADLEGVIEDVDKQILHLFTEAWRDVEAEFPRVFSTLFPGGDGRLVLTDPEDMLTTGIEIEARPPGKRVKRLSLLSGGEKSLTALAMLVAIFRARPSPFYVMDEVEAALDDVNLRRLIALFEEMRKDSQLIVITHQKPTMDIANVLYGVTMRGDGITRVLSQRMHPQVS